MKRILRGSHVLLVVLLSCCSCLSSAAEVIQKQPSGSINWSTGVVTASGYGVAPTDVAAAKKRLLARRAAQLDAYRNLGEMLSGVRVTSESIVKEMVAESDTVKTSLESFVKGARIVSDHYQNDVATVEVALSLDGTFMRSVSPQIPADTFAYQAVPFDVLSRWSIAQVVLKTHFHSLSAFVPFVYASEQQARLEITGPEQLRLVKQLSELLRQRPVEEALALLEENIQLYEDNARFTGLLIDASSVADFELATIPRIRDNKGNVLYPSYEELKKGTLAKRPVGYDFDVTDAIRNQRIAVKPYVVKAIGVYNSRKSDLIIGDEAAQLLKTHQALLAALGNAGVMIVVPK